MASAYFVVCLAVTSSSPASFPFFRKSSEPEARSHGLLIQTLASFPPYATLSFFSPFFASLCLFFLFPSPHHSCDWFFFFMVVCLSLEGSLQSQWFGFWALRGREKELSLNLALPLNNWISLSFHFFIGHMGTVDRAVQGLNETMPVELVTQSLDIISTWSVVVHITMTENRPLQGQCSCWWCF